MIKLSGYKIIKKIGSGGMGDVYLAEHEKLEKKVAIKSLHKNLATDNTFRERFSNEAKTHSKLDHPNIVKLLDYRERKVGLFLIMEYVDGKQLDDYIKKVTGPIPEKELTTLFTQVLGAIGYAHEEGLVHRDIKPSNIMIDNRGRIKVLDFGIAKMQEEEKGLTKTGMQIGTASYMSPEQVNAKKVDKLTDIYSLGVTLFYMAVGKSPYDEETNTFSIQTKIVSEPFPLASKFYPGVSKKLEAIILKSTQKNKKDRYQSCEEFKKTLNSKNVVDSEKIKARSKTNVVKTEKTFKLSSYVSIVVLLFSIGSLFVIYNNYQTEINKANASLTTAEDPSSLIIESTDLTDKVITEHKRFIKEKAEQERLVKEKAEQERLVKEKAEQERLAKDKAMQEKNSLKNFLNQSDLYFDNISFTLNSAGRYFLTNLLRNNYRGFHNVSDVTNNFSDIEILIVDRKYIVLISVEDYDDYYCDIYNALSGSFIFQAKKLNSKTACLSWSYSKSKNILCSDQGLGFFYRKNYFKISQFEYSSSFKNFSSYFRSYVDDLSDVPIYKWK